MKKICLTMISLLSLGITSQAVLAASIPDQEFNTIAEAQQYCPPTNGLVFTPFNSNPHIGGVITGSNSSDGLTFKSTQPSVMAPQSMAPGNLINGVVFNDNPGFYGYVVNNVVTCMYLYPGYTGIQVTLALRSTNPSTSH